ncbi:hypothetical protein GWI33_023188 [Rhynchophorus ferrugineus]|uniref:Uncharacterized protein n=1 Tax=Rhynchophorus ferrugineus TaxID=354439 RepID=A0A834IZW4_RHYFE|nr:hypothetical protein GWI33_023188 [Rhynchophorus ferrugineus]
MKAWYRMRNEKKIMTLARHVARAPGRVRVSTTTTRRGTNERTVAKNDGTPRKKSRADKQKRIALTTASLSRDRESARDRCGNVALCVWVA